MAVPVLVAHESLSVAMESAPAQGTDPRDWPAAVEMAQNMDNNPHLLDAVMQLLVHRGRAAAVLLAHMDEDECARFMTDHVVPHMQFKRARK